MPIAALPLLEEELWVAAGVPVILALGVAVALADDPLLLDEPLLELLIAPEVFTTTPPTVPTCWPFWPFTFIFKRSDNRTN